MGWFWGFCERFNAIFHRKSIERKLDEDIQLYLENSIERNIERGMDPEEARRIAYRDFGGVERNKERTRDEQGVRPLLDLSQDIRYGIRTLRKNPGFTTVALLTLALGIGANAAVFSVVDDVLINPLYSPEQERIVQILDTFPPPRPEAALFKTTIPNFFDYRNQNEVFEHVAALRAAGGPSGHIELYLESPERPEKVTAEFFSSDLLAILGVKLVLGREFLPDEDLWGAPQAMILTHGFWQQQFGGDPDIIGEMMSFLAPEGVFTIVGVLPPDFHSFVYAHTDMELASESGVGFKDVPDCYISMSHLDRRLQEDRRYRFIVAMARLKPGVTLEQAQANIDGVAARITAEDPSMYDGYRAVVTPLLRLIHQAYGPGLYMICAAAGFVLLLVCANVANLLMSRALRRERELAVRSSLGAGRGRLFRQLLTESVLLGALGGVVGLLPAYGGTKVLVSLSPSYMFGLSEVSVDVRVLVFVVVIATLTALFIGLLPAFRNVRLKINEAIKGGESGSPGGRLRLLHIFVVAQVALALVLLTGAGLVLHSFSRLMNVDPGYDVEKVLIMDVETLPGRLSHYQNAEAVAGLFARIVEHVETMPGVISAAGVDYPPLGTSFHPMFTIADERAPTGEEGETLNQVEVTPGYFETMGIQLLTGRVFTDGDADQYVNFANAYRDYYQQYQDASKDERARMRHEHAIPVVINESMSQRYWPGQNPLGKGIYIGNIDPENPPPLLWTIIGVVEDIKSKRIERTPSPQAFFPALISPKLMIRTHQDPRGMIDVLASEIEAVDRTELSVSNIELMKERYVRNTSESRYQMALIVIFATIATILAAVGLFGVMAYSVARRTHEIGVRLSLGAQPGEIRRLILNQSMFLTVIGIIIGLAGSFVLARSISGLLYGVSPIDPVTTVSVLVLIGAVSLLASYIPTRRASRVDPVEALRSE